MIEMTGKQALLEQLGAEGVQHIFGNPGTSEQPFMDLLQDYPQFQYVLALHEATAVGMADGYAWASGRPAFVQLHIAPGLGNAMGMLYNAHRTCTPLVVYAGQHSPSGVVQEAILAADLVRIAEPLTKWAVEVHNPADIPTVLRRAFIDSLQCYLREHDVQRLDPGEVTSTGGKLDMLAAARAQAAREITRLMGIFGSSGMAGAVR